MKEPKNEEIEDNTEQDLTLFLEPKLREELTAECLEDNRLANVKLIKVQQQIKTSQWQNESLSLFLFFLHFSTSRSLQNWILIYFMYSKRIQMPFLYKY